MNEDEIERDEEYLELMAELRVRRQEMFHVGRILGQIKERKKYGQYLSFEELVRHELDMHERTAFRLVFASEMRERMVAAGIKTLPTAEAQVRPLSRIPEELRLQAWLLACTMTADPPPAANAVTRAIQQLGGKQEPTKETLDTVREYRHILREAGGCLARAVRLTEDSEFRAFIETGDRKTHVRVCDQLIELVNSLRGQLAIFAAEKSPKPLSHTKVPFTDQKKAPSHRETASEKVARKKAFSDELKGSGRAGKRAVQKKV